MAAGNLHINVQSISRLKKQQLLDENELRGLNDALTPLGLGIYNAAEISGRNTTEQIQRFILFKPISFLKLTMSKSHYDGLKQTQTNFGLINTGGAQCFINAGFQALLSLPIFRLLITRLPPRAQNTQLQPLIDMCKSSVERGVIDETKLYGFHDLCYNVANINQGRVELKIDERLGFRRQGDTLTDFISKFITLVSSAYFNTQLDTELFNTIIMRPTIQCFTYDALYTTLVSDQPTNCTDLSDIADYPVNLAEAITSRINTIHFYDDRIIKNVIGQDGKFQRLSILVKIPLILSHLIIVNMTNKDNSKLYNVGGLSELDIELAQTPALNKKYELLACVMRFGQSASGGHYTCLAKRNNQWIYFNDNIVQNTNTDIFTAAVDKLKLNNHIQLLFYHEIPRA
jgi:hypothetical protein